MDNAPKFYVTIRCTTYNQKEFILDALHSFVMQETSFPVLILIVDDASTDGTGQAIRSFIAQEFDINDSSVSQREQDDYSDNLFARHRTKKNCYIISMNLKHNLYHDQPKKHSLFAKWIACSKYVAPCDGDDYWIDRHKLQKQVDFLEANPNCYLVFHNALLHFQDKDIPDCLMKSFQSGMFSTAQIFDMWQLPFSSILYRSSIEETEIFKKLMSIQPGGFVRFIASSLLGDVYGMAECMSVYRKNKNGVSTGMTQAQCLANDYRLALGTGDEDAVKAMHKHSAQKLLGNMHGIIKGDTKARAVWHTAMKYNRWIPYKIMAYYLINWPIRMADKLKHKLFG